MNWFDTSGLANIAKSALKEAQKTIDKALDIKEEDQSIPPNTPIDTNSEDFFTNWGITQSGKIKNEKEAKGTKPPKLGASIWGSFTGSFFENQDGEGDLKSPSIESLDDSLDPNEHFKSSKLVVQNSEDQEHSKSMLDSEPESNVKEDLVEIDLDAKLNTAGESVKSSESLDVLNSAECTTSPESELISVGNSFSASSSFGIKNKSDSLEILGDSLTSPSSVEVLGFETSSSKLSQEFVSPLDSPWSEEKPSPIIEKSSPESVEVIPEDQDESIAEDTMSYTSVSESTSATVLDSAFNLFKQQKMLKDTFTRPDMNDSLTSEASLSPDKSFNFTEAITRAPSRTALHLPIANQVMIDIQPQINPELPSFKKTNVIDIPQDSFKLTENLESSTEDGSQSDKTVVFEGMESSSDTSLIESSTNSACLKTMLADAMTEKDVKKREGSPISSESRSDLVKIGSDQTSGHTSGDELETTTSSDIEIISSPNGDSSSTQSRQSPAKATRISKHEESPIDALLCKMTMKKAKGHTRELSEASSISDDSHSSEVEKMIRKIAEMTEILESRESKLIDLNQKNAELQQLNNELKQQVDGILTKQLETVDVTQVTEEYTQRMSALEKRFQQAIREKDSLRKQLEQAKNEAAMRMSKGELETLILEKDEVIKELREEGEKLSKQQLQHSNIIKKLRVKEKDNESAIKQLRESVESLTTEADRLKRSLSAKEEVERTQIEAVHQLTAKNKKLESEVNRLQSQLDDLNQKYDTAKKSLGAAKKELVDKNRTSSELQAREQMLANLENQKRMTESQNEEIINQLEDLRQKLREADQEFGKKEQQLRLENVQLLQRLEEAEGRNEELSQSVLEVSKPLVRQLESLQATHNMKVSSFEKIEQELTFKINDLKAKLQSTVASERKAKEEALSFKSKLPELEAQCTSLTNQKEMLLTSLDQAKTEKQMAEQDLKGTISKLEDKVKKLKEKLEDRTKEVENLKQQLNMEKVAVMEHKKSASLTDQFGEPSLERAFQTRSNSPTLSLGKASNAESVNSSFWSQDEPFEVSQTPRYTNMFEMQMLQSNLKQRDGEVQQLQWELNRREQERFLMNTEISTLLTKVESLEGQVRGYEEVKVQLEELQKQYDTLCQLFGEKVEENEELKLDLQEVKEMYKEQIDELIKQQAK